jgi:hypothetical protein
MTPFFYIFPVKILTMKRTKEGLFSALIIMVI